MADNKKKEREEEKYYRYCFKRERMTITAGRSDNRGRKTHGEKQEKKEERR